MNALSIRLPDELLEVTSRLAKELDLTRAEYVRTALEGFNRINEQRLFQKALANSVAEVNNVPYELDEWDAVLADGLNNA